MKIIKRKPLYVFSLIGVVRFIVKSSIFFYFKFKGNQTFKFLMNTVCLSAEEKSCPHATNCQRTQFSFQFFFYFFSTVYGDVTCPRVVNCQQSSRIFLFSISVDRNVSAYTSLSTSQPNNRQRWGLHSGGNRRAWQ